MLHSDELFVTVTLKDYERLTRNDERLRIILDMLGDNLCVTRDEIMMICGVEKVEEEK